MKRIFLSSLVICFYQSAFSNIRHVPSGYLTIQAALNACNTADTVLVQPGTYTEAITWPGVAGIKLLSAGDSANTIISGNHIQRPITINTAMADSNSMIMGFGILNGLVSASHSYGGGIMMTNASINLRSLYVSGNHLASANWNYGAGLYISGGSPRITDCRITGNVIDSATWGHGAGIYATNGAHVEITGSIIDQNIAGSSGWCYGTGIYAGDADLMLSKVKITENRSMDGANYFYGTAVYLSNTQTHMENVLIASNIMGINGSFYRGGAIYLNGDTASDLFMTHVTVAGNQRADGGTITGSGLYINEGSLNATGCIFYNPNTGAEVTLNPNANSLVSYSNVRGGATGTGNINTLPLFMSASDFHLGPNSPCFGSGSPMVTPAEDLESNPRPLPAFTQPDMGCYEADQTVVGKFTESRDEVTIKANPNPFTGVVTISISDPSGKDIIIQLYTAQGVPINLKPHSLGNGNYELDGGSLPSGIYLCRAGSSLLKLIRP